MDATEGGDLRHLGDDRQDGIHAFTKRVVEQTAMGEDEVSRGADTKANTLELVRVPSSLLQRSQRGVALQALGESGSSFRAESVSRETASMGADAGDEGCQRR